MAAAIGNKYAEKWTLETTSDKLEEMLKTLKKNKGIYLMSSLAVKFDLYHQIFSEWADKFPEEQKVSDTIKLIKSICQARVQEGGMEGKYKETMSIFTLKVNHGLIPVEKQEVINQAKEEPKTIQFPDGTVISL